MCCNSTVVGDYGELRFLFQTSRLPSAYQSKKWQAALSSALISKVQSSYLTAYHFSYVEVVGVGLQNTSSSEQPSLAQRSEGVEFLYVDVNLMPESLSPHDIETIKNVSEPSPFCETT